MQEAWRVLCGYELIDGCRTQRLASRHSKKVSNAAANDEVYEELALPRCKQAHCRHCNACSLVLQIRPPLILC